MCRAGAWMEGRTRAILTSLAAQGSKVLELVKTLFLPYVSGIMEFPGKKGRKKKLCNKSLRINMLLCTGSSVF